MFRDLFWIFFLGCSLSFKTTSLQVCHFWSSSNQRWAFVAALAVFVCHQSCCLNEGSEVVEVRASWKPKPGKLAKVYPRFTDWNQTLKITEQNIKGFRADWFENSIVFSVNNRLKVAVKKVCVRKCCDLHFTCFLNNGGRSDIPITLLV